MYTLQFDPNQPRQNLLPLTVFRRNVGSFVKKLPQTGSLILTKGGTPVAQVVPIVQTDSVEKKLAKLKTLLGGFHLGNPTPEELNNSYDQMYDEMLPR